MNQIEKIAAELECTRMINEFSRCTDTFDYDTAVAMFVPEGKIVRVGHVFEGLDGIRGLLESRDKNRITRHVTTNIIIDVIDENTAKGSAYAIIYGHMGPLGEGEFAPLGTPDSLVSYDVDFRRTDAGWRMVTFNLGLSFQRPAA